MASRVATLADRIDSLQRRVGPLAFATGVVKKFGADRAGKLAAVVAYYAFFSFFPIMLVATTVLGSVLAGNETLRTNLIDSALAQFPVVGSALRNEADVKPLSGSAFTLLIGLAGALWGGLRAMQVAQDAMNDVWDVPLRDRPNFALMRLRALIMLVVIGGSLALTVGLSAIATQLPVAAVGRVALLVATALANSATFLLAFQILTVERVRWQALVPGALFAGIGWLVLQSVGAWYVNRVVRGANDVYGTFATVIGLMSLFYLQAQLTLVAAEVNVVGHHRLWPRSLTGRHLTAADRRALELEASSSIRYPGEHVEVRFDD